MNVINKECNVLLFSYLVQKLCNVHTNVHRNIPIDICVQQLLDHNFSHSIRRFLHLFQFSVKRNGLIMIKRITKKLLQNLKLSNSKILARSHLNSQNGRYAKY